MSKFEQLIDRIVWVQVPSGGLAVGHVTYVTDQALVKRRLEDYAARHGMTMRELFAAVNDPHRNITRQQVGRVIERLSVRGLQ